MSETQTAEVIAKAKRDPTVYTKVKMEDGREDVEFAGKRKMNKEAGFDAAAGTASVRFDFVNGKTLGISTSQLTNEIILRAAAHGLSQKCGDNVAGVPELDDMVIGVEEMIAQLVGGAWSQAREAGDSVAGASVVIKAILESLNKKRAAAGKELADIAFVKAFLQGKLDAAKAAGAKLSRQELYAGFRRPDTEVGQIIKRLEEERLAKGSSVDTASLMAEME